MGRAAVFGQPGGRGVTGDDPRDVTGGKWPGRPAGAGQGEQQLLALSDRTDLDPGDDRLQRVCVERDLAGASALGVADGHPPAGRLRDRVAQPAIVGALALVDIRERECAGSERRRPTVPSRYSSARSRLPRRVRRSGIRNSRTNSSPVSARG